MADNREFQALITLITENHRENTRRINDFKETVTGRFDRLDNYNQEQKQIVDRTITDLNQLKEDHNLRGISCSADLHNLTKDLNKVKVRTKYLKGFTWAIDHWKLMVFIFLFFIIITEMFVNYLIDVQSFDGLVNLFKALRYLRIGLILGIISPIF